MLKYIAILFLFLSNSFCLWGQNDKAILQGKVIDEEDDNAEIIFASIVLKKNGEIIQNTSSDFDGNYRFSNLNAGIYDVEVSYVGLQNLRYSNVKLNAGNTKSLDLKFPKQSTNIRSKVVFIDDDMINTIKMPKHEAIALSGWVFDEEGDTVLSDTKIYLYHNGNFIAGTTSNKSGFYRFPKVVPNYNFTLYVQHSQFPHLFVYKLHLLPYRSVRYNILFPKKSDKNYHNDMIYLFANPPFYRD